MANQNQVCHPTWTNKVRFLTITGPYPDGWDTPSGAVYNEVYVGRFSKTVLDETNVGKTLQNGVEQWVRVTYDTAGVAWPQVWIAGNDEDAVR
jgi:hypothetical protein